MVIAIWKLLAVCVLPLGVAIHIPTTVAAPAPLFTPHLKQVRTNLPSGWKMRLPAQILLGGPADQEFINQLVVRVLPSTTPAGLTVGLFSCNTSPLPCLVGSFSVDRQGSANAEADLKRHQAAAAPIKLAQGVRGYLLEGKFLQPANSFSSVMWKQDEMIYTVSFLAAERQNILYMAYSMSSGNPLFSLAGQPNPRR